MRLKQIDDLTRPDHWYLRPEDRCYYLREYTPGGDFRLSPTNQLIHNLKKSVSLKASDSGQFAYKKQAIAQCGVDLRKAINWTRPANQRITWVPVPPSKSKGDPLYDDRMLQVLGSMTSGLGVDVRELVYTDQSMGASHRSGASRPKPEEIAANYRIDQRLVSPKPAAIGIVDDVLTAGAHFKAMQMVLERQFPGVRTFGLFIARTERQSQRGAADDFEVLDD